MLMRVVPEPLTVKGSLAMAPAARVSSLSDRAPLDTARGTLTALGMPSTSRSRTSAGPAAPGAASVRSSSTVSGNGAPGL